jgi:hypothetical protein
VPEKIRDREGFNYLRRRYEYFQPKTPRAALRAVAQGAAPPSAFEYRATSVKPLYEEPFDLEEIQRILSRKDIDLETLLLVIRILERLILVRDSETALFAAESLNEIENRFTERIDALRNDLESGGGPSSRRNLGKNLFQLAQVSRGRQTLKNFYLREAFGCFNLLTRSEKAEEEDFIYLVRICLELKLFAQAETILEKVEELFGISGAIRLLKAENEFYRKNFTAVIEMCRACDLGDLSAEQYAIIDFWKGQ